MITLLAIICVILAAAALADGISTVRFLKDPALGEIDPIMVWIFGSNRPPSTTVYGRGAAVIISEIAVAIGVTYFYHSLGYVFIAGALIQSAVHVRATVLNSKLS
jgi:hypothetical protein